MLLRLWVSVVHINAFSVVYGSAKTSRTKCPSVCAVAGGRQAVRSERVFSTKLGPLCEKHETQFYASSTPPPAAKEGRFCADTDRSPGQPPSAMPVDAAYAESIVERMRVALKKRGAEGIRGLDRNFKICDTNGSGKLDEEELAKCFRLCKLTLRSDEIATMVAYFDHSGDGLVSFEEFLRVIRGRMSPQRKNLVVKVFNALDNRGDGNGMLTAEDIKPFFNAGDHPAVKAGDKTEEQVLGEFLMAFEGRTGDHDGTITLDEWIKYYEELSSSIDEDDFFGGMVASTWSTIRSTDADGNDCPAIIYVSEGDMNLLEKILKKNIYGKSQGVNEERTLKAAFKQFDTDGSGEVSYKEFVLAMERFGLQCQKPGARGKGGVPPEVMRGLFDRYNADQSDCISYQEFSDGLFASEKAEKAEELDGPNEQGGQNPWLPTLAHKVSMDPNYHRPNTAQRVRSIANPKRNVFSLD